MPASSRRQPRKLLRAYIDETGDRGAGGSASPFFAFAAVVVPDEEDADLRAAVSRLRRDLGVPLGKPLHWKDHVKVFARRQHVASVLGKLDHLCVNYVVVEKAAIPAASRMRIDQAVFYNYAAGFIMERLALTARDWPGGPRDVIVRFAHVRGFDHRETARYFDHKRRSQAAWIPWEFIHWPVLFDGTGNWDGLQAADQYAGMLSSAIRADPFGGYEPQHLLAIRHQIRRSRTGTWGYGFKFLGNDPTVTDLPWWPQNGL